MSAHLFTPRRLAAASPSGGPAFAASAPAPKFREAGALVFIAAALYLSLSLGSVRLDPGDAGVRGADWVGPVGALVGGVLARGFGLVAWLGPVEFVLLALPFLRPSTTAITALRLTGDLVVAVILSSLVHIAAPAALAFGALPASGNVGFFFGELLSALFSAVGSFLVGGTVVGLILIGRQQFSFIEWVSRLSRAARTLEAWGRAF